MHKSNRSAFTNITQILLDILCLVVAYAFIDTFFGTLWSPMQPEKFLWVLFAFSIIFFFVMQSLNMYIRTTFMYRDRVVRNILSSSLCGAGFCLLILPFISNFSFQNKFLGAYILIATVLLILQRMTVIQILNHSGGRNGIRCLAVGDVGIISQYQYFMKKTSVHTTFVGYVPTQAFPANPSLQSTYAMSLKNLGTLDQLEQILTDNVVDEVLFAIPRNYESEVEKHVLLCEERGLTVKIALDLYDLNVAKTYVYSIGTIPVLTYHTVSLNNFQNFLKRVMDVVGALVGLVLTAIISIFVVPIILLDSKGPVFFSQRRVGQNGRIFHLYKFRSMCADAEAQKKTLQAQNRMKDGYMFKLDHDPRITRVGAFIRKTSIDELPQFINVLMGDMSLVGTRPPTLDEVEKYQNLHHRRISIKPGITGMWQVSGRSNIRDFSEVCRLDTSYIDNWSVWTDIVIILKTITVIFGKRGAI